MIAQPLAGPLHALRAFARAPAAPACAVCSAVLAVDHAHLLDRDLRRPACACSACAALFASRADAAGLASRATVGRYTAIVRRVRRLGCPEVAAHVALALDLPVGLAYVVPCANADARVLYPGAAGVIEGRSASGGWPALTAAHAELRAVAPDVEGLLLHGAGDAPGAAVVSIDVFYELAARVRGAWGQRQGESAVHAEVARVLAAEAARAEEGAP